MLLRQFWITERTCGQLSRPLVSTDLAASEPHQSFPGWPAGNRLRLVMADTPAKTQQSQAESVCLLGMGFLCQPFPLTQHKVPGLDVGSPLFKTPWRPALLLCCDVPACAQECAHPRMVLRGWLATSCCW